MRSVPFEIAEWEDVGSIGMRIEGRRWADPGEGLSMAHDILEHRTTDEGTPEQELMALGTMMWVRGDTGLLTQNSFHSEASMLAGDFDTIQRYIDQNDVSMYLRNPGRTYACDRDNTFIDSLVEGKRLLDSEYRDNDCRDGPLHWLDTSTGHAYALGWLRKGYRNAARRYRKFNDYNVAFMFTRIKDAVDSFLRTYGDEAYRGVTGTLRYDIKRGEVRIKVDDIDY